MLALKVSEWELESRVPDLPLDTPQSHLYASSDSHARRQQPDHRQQTSFRAKLRHLPPQRPQKTHSQRLYSEGVLWRRAYLGWSLVINREPSCNCGETYSRLD